MSCKKVVKAVKRRKVVRYLMGRYSVGLRRACRRARMSRGSYRYSSCKDPQSALRLRVRELAQTRVRFGYRRIFMMLRREGWDLGKDKLYRVYREEGLGLRRKRPWRHVTAVHREMRTPARHRNDVWSMDFVHDELADGRKFRTLTVSDVFTRECLEIEVGQSLKAEDVVRVMERLKDDRGVPARIYCDNGWEFVSGQMDQWAYSNSVKIEFSRLGKPTDNAVVESFNGRFREECLNTHWFESLDDARAKINAWRRDYNEHRPHRSLEGLTPREFARRAMLAGAAD